MKDLFSCYYRASNEILNHGMQPKYGQLSFKRKRGQYCLCSTRMIIKTINRLFFFFFMFTLSDEPTFVNRAMSRLFD